MITGLLLSTYKIHITVILLNGMYLNGCLYYSGLCITHSALSTAITVSAYIKLCEYMHFFQDPLCQYTIPQHVDICNINLLLSHSYHSVCNENLKDKDQ